MQTRALTHSRLIKHNIERLDSVLPSINQANSHEIRLYRMEPNNADQKSATSKPFSIQAANWKSSALITKIKRPSVIIVTGKVSSTSSGRINALIKPSTTAATKVVPKPRIWMDEMIYGKTNRASALINQIINIRIIDFSDDRFVRSGNRLTAPNSAAHRARPCSRSWRW